MSKKFSMKWSVCVIIGHLNASSSAMRVIEVKVCSSVYAARGKEKIFLRILESFQSVEMFLSIQFYHRTNKIIILLDYFFKNTFWYQRLLVRCSTVSK